LHSAGFAQRVSAALEHEPALLAPARWSTRRLMRRIVAPGAAVAAAAALLVVVAVPQLTLTDSTGPQLAKAPAAVSNSGQLIQPVGRSEIARVPELERYLVAHRELAGGSVMPVSAPYLRTSTALPSGEER
jgi:hypothetical protein